MGYLSSGSGTLILRNKNKLKEAEEFLKSEDYAEYTINGIEFDFSFFDWKMYYSKSFFGKLAEYFNTLSPIEVSGEDSLDVWRIHLKNGKITVQFPKSLEWNKPTELNMELGE